MASTLRRLRAQAPKLVFATHRAIYELSDGRVGAHAKLPMLLLTTVGRKSGEERTTPLAYMTHGDAFVVVGSDGAARKHPHWHLNLLANPLGKVRVGRERFAVRARVATGKERDALWERGKTFNPMWSTYQTRTERAIPVVVLDRIA